MSSNEIAPRNRAERRSSGKRMRAAGAALTAGSAALAMGAAWVGTGGMQAAGAATTLHVTSTADAGAGTLRDQIGAASSVTRSSSTSPGRSRSPLGRSPLPRT